MDAYESLVTTMRNSILSGILVLALASPAPAQQTSANAKWLAEALKRFPAADTNKDGILTMAEARAFQRKRGQQGAKGPRLDVHSPTEDEIRFELAGNICRCTGYDKIIRSVQEAARLLKEGDK